jgi:hypothetical protein
LNLESVFQKKSIKKYLKISFNPPDSKVEDGISYLQTAMIKQQSRKQITFFARS